MEEREYTGACGLYCGLCPKFQSTAPSRCLGCQLGPQHDYCGVYRCTRKRGHWTCAECEEYPCERLRRTLGLEQGVDSFVSHKPVLPNLERMREVGLEAHLAEQRERRLLVEELLREYNEGRSMSFFCAAGALMPPQAIRQAMQEMEELLATGQVDGADVKAKAKAMRLLLTEHAMVAGIDLKLRKG